MLLTNLLQHLKPVQIGHIHVQKHDIEGSLTNQLKRPNTAIDLDDNFSLMAGEVSEVSTDRRLTPKVMLLEWRLAQMLPELLFGFGRIATQSSRAWHAVVNRTLRCLCHPPPTPDPSPPRASRAEGGEQVRARNTKIQNRSHNGTPVTAPPASVCTQASPQAFASSRTRMM